jgi:hypothetical protein
VILSVIQLAQEFFQSRSAAGHPKEDTGDLQIDLSMSSKAVGAKAGLFFAWLIGFFFCIWLLGFFIAVPLYTFLYLKLSAKEHWLISSVLTLAMFIFFVALFDQVLHLPWPTPVVEGPEQLIRSSIPQLDFWN